MRKEDRNSTGALSADNSNGSTPSNRKHIANKRIHFYVRQFLEVKCALDCLCREDFNNIRIVALLPYEG